MVSVPLHKQFVASFGDDVTFDGAQTVDIGRLHVRHSPDLPAHTVELDGEPAVILGWPTHTPASSLTEADLDDLAGSWIALTQHQVLPDPLGSYASVFSADLGAVASSAAMLPRASLRPRESLNRVLDLPEQNNFYPFALTPWSNVERLSPNHRLDLHTWQARRVYRPVVTMGRDEAIDVVVRNFTRNLTALAGHPLMIGMTAGNETRMLVAGLKDAKDVYGWTFGTGKTMDTVTAGKVAELAGIRWELRPNRVDAAASHRWFENVGECIAGFTMRNASAKELLPGDRIYVKGMGGEIGRAYYYSKGTPTYFPGVDAGQKTMTPHDLVHVLHLPAHAELDAAAEKWLASISQAQDIRDELDLHFWDNRMGGWAAPQSHADQTLLGGISYPLNQHSTLDALRALPLHDRQTDQLSPLVVSRLWPELLKIPINREPLQRRLAISARRLKSSLKH